MGELAEEQRILDTLPGWVPTYLACWGSTRPDGKRMSVTWAAGLAGVSPDAVRQLRARSRQFRMMEHVCRQGGAEFMASYASAGVRAMAPEILTAMRDLITDRNPRMVSEAVKILLGQTGLDVHLSADEAIKLEMVWGDYAEGDPETAEPPPEPEEGLDG